MEYLTLQDIPHRHHHPLRSRRMTSSHSTERPMVNMAAAVSDDPEATSFSFPSSSSSSSPRPSPIHPRVAMSSLPADWRLEENQSPWTPSLSESSRRPPPLQHILLPSLSHSNVQRPTREEPPRWADSRVLSPIRETSGPRNNHEEPSQSIPTNITLTDVQNHHMRHSPPIQPGEQNFPAKLPSFTEFLNTTRASTPPRTPSRRHGSANSSPQTQPQPQPHPHFDDVAWAEGKRRRVDTLGDIYARPPVALEQPPVDLRRMSSAIERRPVRYDAVRVAQHEEAQPSLPMHHHRPTNSYPPPPHPSLASNAHLRHQSTPPVSQGSVIYPPQPRHSIANHTSYPPPSVPHGPAYEQRPGYYQDPQRANSMYGYERSHDAYYHQPPYPGPGFDSTYGDNIRFQQHVGLDQSAFNRKRRGNLPKEATNVLKEWYGNHRASPYPTEDQKLELCSQTGLSLNQVSNWFINARRRAPHKEQREREANNPGA